MLILMFKVKAEGALLTECCVDYLLRVWLHHNVTIDEDGADNGEGEQRVGEHMDGNPGTRISKRHGLSWSRLIRYILPSDWVKR